MIGRTANLPTVSAVTILPSVRLRGTDVTRGCQVTVAGIRGRCEVYRVAQHDSGAIWIDVITSQMRSRTISAETVRTIHNPRGTK